MRAVTCTHAQLDVVDLPDPTPERGQVLVEVTRCGICGSDLHARHGFDTWADMAAQLGYDRFGRSDQPIVLGHEFLGEIAEYGPKTRGKLKSGRPSSRYRCCAGRKASTQPVSRSMRRGRTPSRCSSKSP